MTFFARLGRTLAFGFGLLFGSADPSTPSPVAANDAGLGDKLALVPGVKLPLPPTERAAFAAGCFWGVEEAFRKEPGVLATAVGFMGGHVPHPSYRQVCTQDTGHAETVLVVYDPQVVTYPTLVDLFFSLHDPTTRNRQGPDVGDQYRSAIFTFNDRQQAEALAGRDRLARSKTLSDPIVTEITAASAFTPAEDYHQQYVEKGGVAFCHVRRKRGATLNPDDLRGPGRSEAVPAAVP